jgi:hypothetical protein
VVEFDGPPDSDRTPALAEAAGCAGGGVRK